MTMAGCVEKQIVVLWYIHSTQLLLSHKMTLWQVKNVQHKKIT
jgi:hypothetical protein